MRFFNPTAFYILPLHHQLTEYGTVETSYVKFLKWDIQGLSFLYVRLFYKQKILMTGFELQTYWDRSDCYINSATITSVVAAKTVKEKALEQSAKNKFCRQTT